MPVCTSCGQESPEPFRFCGSCGARLHAEADAGVRKTVTVLFCDVAGSTALGDSIDPEALRAVLARYFERMKAIVERHGGTVEKFIGDAVMAVFGVPIAHEDDALRAVRAADEMRDALPELDIQARIGVNTGEVVAGTEERLATGDAVNVAARLEQAAQPGEILLGEPTLALIHEAVEVEEVEHLALKGKNEPVAAYRLLQMREAPERRHETRFVGRERELALLRHASEQARTAHRCQLVTIAGDAGVGKSRLVAEFVHGLDAMVVRSRCLPYGEGITYWAVIEVLKQLDVLPEDKAAAAAIRSLLGETEAETSAEEIAWAFRKTLEQAAARESLLVVFDDIQWGEETFLDLIEHVALLSSGAAILLLCITRPELTERRTTWAVTLRLEPLDEDDVNQLIPEYISGNLREKITRAAGGNPLFIEEMLAMAGGADGEVAVPPTLQALLAARLDQLESGERSVLERGAVEGEIFHRGAVQALTPEVRQVTRRLAALVRKELIRPDRARLAGDDGFRFRHLLIRDAAYEALPKATRAQLHARFATWLEQHSAELLELDEILGYHLEQACRYRTELGLPYDAELAAAARRRLIDASRRAQLRSDYGAVVSLLERAETLEPTTKLDRTLETQIVDALYWAGKGEDALVRAESLAERAAAAGDRVGELCGRIHVGIVQMDNEPERATQELAALVEYALPVLQAADDDVALYVGYSALGWVAFIGAQMDEGLEAFERAAVHARQAGLLNQFLGWRAAVRFYGTTQVSELLAWLDENESPAGWNYWLRTNRGRALAMLGRVDEARAILADARAELAERGPSVQLGWTTAFHSFDTEFLAGDSAAAVEFGAEGFRLLEELGEQAFLPSVAGRLAQALYTLDRIEDADVWASRAAELGASHDRWTQMLWRQVMAKVHARRGEHAEAERLAREAMHLCEETDMLDAQGEVYADLADVLLLSGKADEAATALTRALECHERKGNVVMAERMRARLAGRSR